MRYKLCGAALLTLALAALICLPPWPQIPKIGANPPLVTIQAVPVVPQPVLRVQVPAYGAGYSPGLSQADLDKITEHVRKAVQADIKRELRSQKGANKSAVPQPNVPEDVAAPAKGAWLQGLGGFAKCAKCHDRTTANRDGDGLVLTDGDRLRVLGALEAYWVTMAVFVDGTMPKGGKLTDSEGIDLADALDEMVGRRK